MKKIYLKNYVTKKRILEFLDTKGFYVLLILCIGIITTTAYLVTKSNLQSYVDNTTLNSISSSIPKPELQPKTDTVQQPDNTSTKSIISEPKIQAPAKNNTSESAESKNTLVNQSQSLNNNPIKKDNVQNKKQDISIQFPVVGEISQDYSKSHLIYSKTLEQWTTHEGLDIASDRGTPVKASLDGMVENVYNDYKYGITIVLDHGNGLKTKYSNLSTDSMVKKGGKINKGDVISGIGNTAIFESGEQPHLHFEVILDNSSVNPKNYLK